MSNTSTRIELKSLLNTRDFGGIVTSDGAVVKPNKLIRSGMLNGVCDEDIVTLVKEKELKTVVDFRSYKEASESPDPDLSEYGVSYHANPILGEEALGITFEKKGESEEKESKTTTENSMLKTLIYAVEELGDQAHDYMTNFYPKLVSGTESLSHYRDFMQHLLANKEGALLYHCTAGKDRVGVGSMLFLSALSVHHDDIMEDYLLTNRCLEPRTERFAKMALNEGLPKEKVNLLLSMNSVQPEYLEGVFTYLKEAYGSVDHFLAQEMGMDLKARDELMKLYLQ